eukprot:5941088-Prymnesium_polylepis.1
MSQSQSSSPPSSMPPPPSPPPPPLPADTPPGPPVFAPLSWTETTDAAGPWRWGGAAASLGAAPFDDSTHGFGPIQHVRASASSEHPLGARAAPQMTDGAGLYTDGQGRT